MTTSSQSSLNMFDDRSANLVEKYEFEPIKGYPMLNWKGKRPFTSTQYYPAQLKEVHGPDVDGWRNKIYWGDNLQVMSHLLKEYRGKVKLVYIDPPFDSKAIYKREIRFQGNPASNDRTAFEEKQYNDIWTNDEYLQFMYERLVLVREMMAENSSLYLHTDWHKGHHLRCLLDEVFGNSSFKNEIIWRYSKYQMRGMSRFVNNHDVIYWYSKGDNPTYNLITEPLDEPKLLKRKKWDKGLGRIVNVRDEDGRLVYDEYNESKVDDVWEITIIGATSGERTGYPTQKPIELLERIIQASSNPSDIVFDCFMGSGTAQIAALKLGRRFIGADVNLGAVQITTKRLLGIAEELQTQGQQGKLALDDEKPVIYYAGFEVYNVNHYDVFRNPVEAKDLLLEALEVQRLEQGHLFDGEKDGRMVKVMPVNRIATRADLSELIAGLDYKAFERRQAERPGQVVEKITLVCMGHEPDLAAVLENEAKPFRIDVEVVDILRDKQELQFKRDSEAKVTAKDGWLTIEKFYPMNLLQKLSLQQEDVEGWRELVESVMVDWNYDGAIFSPVLVDIPDKNELVKGKYAIPKDAGTIRVKITDLLSESLEVEVQYG